MKRHSFFPYFLTLVASLCVLSPVALAQDKDCYEYLRQINFSKSFKRQEEKALRKKNVHDFLIEFRERSNQLSILKLEENEALVEKYFGDKYRGESLIQHLSRYYKSASELYEIYEFIPRGVGKRSKKAIEKEELKKRAKNAQSQSLEIEIDESRYSNRMVLKLKSTKGQKFLSFLNDFVKVETTYFDYKAIKDNWDLVLSHYPKEKDPSIFYTKLKTFFGSQEEILRLTGHVDVNRLKRKVFLHSIKKGNSERDEILDVFRGLNIAASDFNLSTVLHTREAELRDSFEFSSIDEFKIFIVKTFSGEREFNEKLYPGVDKFKNTKVYYADHKDLFAKVLKDKKLPEKYGYHNNFLKAKKILESIIGEEVNVGKLRDLLKSIYKRSDYLKFLIRHKRGEFSNILRDYMAEDDWNYDLNSPKDNFAHLRKSMEIILGTNVGYGKVVRYILTNKLNEFDFEIVRRHLAWATETIAKADGITEELPTDQIIAKDLKNDELILVDNFSNPETMLSGDDVDDGVREIAEELGYSNDHASALVLNEIIMKSNYDLDKIVKRTKLDQKTVLEILSILNEKRELLASLL